MPLPDIHDIYTPILEILRDGAPHNLAVNDLMNKASEYFDIGELSSIDRNRFKQRITRARDELKQNKFLTSPSKNTYIITAAGLDYLNNPEESELSAITQPEVHEEVHEIIEAEPESEIVPVEVPEVEPEAIPEIEAAPEPEPVSEIESEPEPEPELSEVYEEIQKTEELPDIPDELEEISGVQYEADDIQLEDEPVEHSDEISPEEAPEEVPEEDITLEDEPELESEQYDTPSEGEDIAASELEPASEPEEQYEYKSESHEPNEDDIKAMNEMNTMNENNSAGIEDAIRIHNEELAEKVLSEMSELSPEMFEVFVVDMLSKMGYRAFHNARYTPNEAGSNMIHGVIIDDKTGAPIYIHARKSSQNKTIGRADMQDFIDALSDKGGKGVFATTAKFSEQAEILANDERIMLIDGMKLAGLMIAHDFCVKVEKVYEIKGLDTESFSEYKR